MFSETKNLSTTEQSKLHQGKSEKDKVEMIRAASALVDAAYIIRSVQGHPIDEKLKPILVQQLLEDPLFVEELFRKQTCCAVLQ